MLSYRVAAKLLVSAVLTMVLTVPLTAGERHHGRAHHGRTSSGIVHSGLPSIVSGLGTYSGALSALRVRGNGIYFAGTGDGDGVRRQARRAPAAKIIEVSSGNAMASCVYEAGVCVIRP